MLLFASFIMLINSEGQEHFGKLIKQAVRLFNQKSCKKTDKTKSGNAKVGYVQRQSIASGQAGGSEVHPHTPNEAAP